MSFHKSCFEQTEKSVKNEVLEKLIEIAQNSKTRIIQTPTENIIISSVLSHTPSLRYTINQQLSKLKPQGFDFKLMPNNITVKKEKIEEYLDRSRTEYKTKYRFIYSLYYADSNETQEFPYTDWKSKYMVYDGNEWHRK